MQPCIVNRSTKHCVKNFEVSDDFYPGSMNTDSECLGDLDAETSLANQAQCADYMEHLQYNSQPATYLERSKKMYFKYIPDRPRMTKVVYVQKIISNITHLDVILIRRNSGKSEFPIHGQPHTLVKGLIYLMHEKRISDLNLVLLSIDSHNPKKNYLNAILWEELHV
ncbi:hypothetical protein NPIL_691331 [Nephila pilipes]|uniref:Uncharacterized protein n=1 Tax=Nephila pilipes TaxID=299642 RepID=A0A8X6N2Q0_NEPPI|nr:hypothetical protein NPIL_691331 [Nephila pilipes]